MDSVKATSPAESVLDNTCATVFCALGAVTATTGDPWFGLFVWLWGVALFLHFYRQRQECDRDA